jgi:hypothetical protein
MIRTALAFLLLSSTASAQVVAHPGGDRFAPEAPPVALTWTLANSAGDSVSVSVRPQLSSAPQVFLIRESDAASFGVDWSAWQAAVNDRSYDISSMSFGSQQGPQQQPARFFGALHVIRIGLSPYTWPSTTPIATSAYAFPPPLPFPEPATMAILLTSLLLWPQRAGGRRSVRRANF